ncbi:MAG: hypothetical protein OXD44_04970 [Gammaproteobacteria bacterium]|nr:hypothetical protein [Gammaproteobacteria bacterium]MCY4313039.1 hypothetical protein [Gammaproteobacteria bacterium]
MAKQSTTINRELRKALIKYVVAMEKVKRRINNISQISSFIDYESTDYEKWEEMVESLAKELKSLLEMLPYSCLGLQIPDMGEKAKNYKNRKAYKLIKPDNAQNSPFLQRPIGQTSPFLVIDPSVKNNCHLTEEKWISAWAWCNRFAHVPNPVNQRSVLTLDLKREWGNGIRFVQRVINLLDMHTVIAKGNLDVHGRVRMEGVNGYNGVIMEVIARQTHWANKIKMPDGTTAILQKKNALGVYETPNDGSGISLHSPVGYCTKDGFLYPNPA